MNRLPFLLAALLLMAGCSPIQPQIYHHQEPSWDGSAQNSGMISDVDSSATFTAAWRNRYNALIEPYGTVFEPALSKDEGLTLQPDGTCHANHFARIHFFKMNTWDISGMHQPTLLQKAQQATGL